MDRRSFLALLGAAAATPLVRPLVPGYTRLIDSNQALERLIDTIGCANRDPWMGAKAGALRLQHARMVHIDKNGRFSDHDDFDWLSYDRGLCRSEWLLTFAYNPQGFDLVALIDGKWKTLSRCPLADMSELLSHEICEFQCDRGRWESFQDSAGWLSFRERRT